MVRQLLPFEAVDPALARSDEAYRILRPQPLPFVSHPYEWCPSQLRDAALLTLRVQQAALDHGMTLKDASAYNVQFVGARPVFIDHLSFDLYEAGAPWQGYRQFCQHFLAPLALVCLVDVRLTQLPARPPRRDPARPCPGSCPGGATSGSRSSPTCTSTCGARPATGAPGRRPRGARSARPSSAPSSAT